MEDVKRKSAHTEPQESPTGKKGRSLDPGRKLDIIGILMMVFAAFLFLALVSHSSADEGVSDIGVVGLFKLLGGDPEMQARADVTHNWLGLIGALIARFFILLTVGYFSLAFPVLLGMWGWFIVRRHDLRALAYYTNYILLVVFLASSFTGLLRLVTWIPQVPVSWAGNIGDFVAGIIARLIGTTGGVLAILASLLIIAVVVVDYDIRVTLERMGSFGSRLAGFFGRKAAAIPAAAQGVAAVYEGERQRVEESRDAAQTTAAVPAASVASVVTPPVGKTSAAPDFPVPAPQPVPVAATVRRRATGIDAPASAPAPGAAPRAPISIEWPAGANALPSNAEAPVDPIPVYASAATDNGTLRSNGVISRDSIKGLRDLDLGTGAGADSDSRQGNGSADSAGSSAAVLHAAALNAGVPVSAASVSIIASGASLAGRPGVGGISEGSLGRQSDEPSFPSSPRRDGEDGSMADEDEGARGIMRQRGRRGTDDSATGSDNAAFLIPNAAGSSGAGAQCEDERPARNGDIAARNGDAAPGRSRNNAGSQSEEAPFDFDDPEPVLVNEHEKKAVQQAVARRMADAEDSDTESMNIRTMKEHFAYRHPTADLLDAVVHTSKVSSEELHRKAELVREKLAIFGIDITSISVVPGPVVTQFELVPDSAVKISKIVSLADDLALALAARGIRIIAPIPGKSAVGIEIPNNEPEFVHFRSVAEADDFARSRMHLPLGLGKDIKGKISCADLARMPHLLIAGATGSGKSVGLNVMITSLLYKMKPWEVKFVMIDPKKIELAQYRGLSRHFLAVSPDIDEEIITDPTNAVIVLKSLELEMDKRYTKLAKAGVRHVNDYNAKVKNGELRDAEMVKHYKLPYIVVVIDELADLMITAAREVEEPIARLAQLARAVGIHLIVATQRPSVDVLTGVIKANFSARVAYQTASRIDSRTILDGPGADQLLGNGDMLYLPSGSPKPERIQNAFLSTAEVERVVEFISEQTGHVRPYQLPSVKNSKKGGSREDSVDVDDLVYEAARLIVRHQQGSVSLLQRRLKIGYSRAARIVDQLETVGIVGPYDGSKAREVLVEDPEMLEEILQTI